MEDHELDAIENEWQYKTGMVPADQIRKTILSLVYTIQDLKEQLSDLKMQAFSPLEFRLIQIAKETNHKITKQTIEECLGRLAYLKGWVFQTNVEARTYQKNPSKAARRFLGKIIGIPKTPLPTCLTPECSNFPNQGSKYCQECQGQHDTPRM